MNRNQNYILQKRFGYFVFFIALFVFLFNFYSMFFSKHRAFLYVLQYNSSLLIIAFLAFFSTLKEAVIFQIGQITIIFLVAFGTITTYDTVMNLSGEIISLVGIYMAIYYGFFRKHFYLKISLSFLLVATVKLWVILTNMERFTLYLDVKQLWVKYVTLYALIFTIIIFLWLMTKDQIQEYINKSKGIEDRFHKNSVFIDIGKIVWGFLHDIGNLNYSLVDIRILRKNLDKIIEDGALDKDRLQICLESAERIEEKLISVDKKQEQIKKMIKTKHVLHKERIDLNDTLDNLINYFKMTYKFLGFNLFVKLAQNRIYISASPFEFLQAIENIIRNCIEAVLENNGNMLSITVSSVEHKARIFIEDTGGGIKFAKKNGIVDLEEFQIGKTTKAEQGTGWGMYSAINNINHSGGQLIINTFIGVGTSFEILFDLDGGENV